MKKLLYLLILAVVLISCKKEPVTPETPYIPTPYKFQIPAGFPPLPDPEFNPATEEGVKLGRMLYYDTILSTTGRSCSSCHSQSLSFSAPKGPGGFSVPPHVNLGWKTEFTWEGAESVLDHVAIIDLEVPDFIQPNMTILLERLQAHDQYQDLFKKAFGIDITTVSVQERKLYISYAIAQFMRSLISGNSKFDAVLRGEEFFTDAELKGYEIFNTEKGDCFHCHSSSLFADNQFHNIGLDDEFNGIDKGRNLITNKATDLGKFFTPTLRNIELTAPYMHDGRFITLEEVVEFYNSGVKNTATLDPIMTKPGKDNGLNLTETEKQYLISFLKTLTDTSFINNKNFSSPFK